MATAGYQSKVYVTTTDTGPTSSDLINGITSFSWSPSRAKLDTSVLGEAFTNAMAGKSTNDPSVSALYLPADTGQGRLITAFGSGATVWVHFSPDGGTACLKVGVIVLGYPLKSDQGGVVTAEYQLASTTAIGTSTAS